MRRLRKFRDLSSAERLLLLEATLLVVAARIGLWLLPFQALRRLLDRLAPVSGRRDARMAPERISWAVAVVSYYIPAASCLTQALAARALLARHGYTSQLHIGVAKGAHRQLEAHAWVEAQGKIVIGGAIRGRYTPLPDMEREGL